MSRRAILLGLRAGAALLCSACSPALRPPMPLPAPAVAPADRGASVDDLLLRADRAFADRPNADAVAEAQELYLAAAAADTSRVEGSIGVARVASWRVEHEPRAAARAGLLQVELAAAQSCGERSPGTAACDYWLAIALGQQAREHPSTALDGLANMAAALRRAAAAAPELEQAGPDRVLALLLLRAPGWPAGPGDAEEGLAAARRAVALRPDHPPNRLALAEALRAHGDRAEARTMAEAALADASAANDPDAAEWMAQARAALAGHDR